VSRFSAVGDYLTRYDETAGQDPAAGVGLVAGWLRTEPQALFTELRRDRPILNTPLFTLVTRFPDVTEVLSTASVFGVGLYAARMDPALGGPIMLTQDETPLTWREKGLMQAMLDPGDEGRVREIVARAADEALDAAEPEGRIEAVGTLFRHVPIRVCAEYFGFPGPDDRTLSRWSRAVMTDVTANLPGDPELHARSLDAGKEMLHHLRGLLADQRARPGDGTVLARLVGTRLPAELAWPDDRIVINVAGLLLGFLENAAGSAVQVVSGLLRDPRLHEQAAAAARHPDPERFDPFVWEALRRDPFLKMIVRTCVRDHVLAAGTPRETHVPTGRLVLAAVASAMWDENVVPEPGEFRLDRPRHAQLHFGYGPHACLGVHAGAVTVSECVRRLLRRPGVRLLPGPDGEIVRDRGIFPDRFTLGLGEV
jgi:cytochrome P450